MRESSIRRCPISLPEPITKVTFPAGLKLTAYCQSNECLYDPQAVASLYTLQTLTFLIVVVLAFLSKDKNVKPPNDHHIVEALCALALSGVLIDYFYGNYSFDPIWILPNSVSHSPLGLFRYAVLYTIATIGILAITGPSSTEGTSS